MQAVIIAAGVGSRLYPFTKNRPKALINIAGIPLIEFTFNQLLKTKAKITEFILVVNYKQQMIQNHFQDFYNNVPIKYITQKKQLGTGHALLITQEFIKGNFLMLYGDDLYSHQDIQKVIKKPNTMLLQELEDISNFGVVSVDGKGKVMDVIEKPSKKVNSKLINIGVFHFSKEIFSKLHEVELSKRSEYELTDAVKMLASEKKMHYQIANDFWKPVGYPWHILDATKTVLEHRSKNSILHKGTVNRGAMVEEEVSIDTGTVISKGARILGLVKIGKNVKIKDNVTIIGPSSILDNSIIKENTIIETSVIGANSTVGKDCHIHHSVIGDNVEVYDNIKTNYNDPDKIIKVNVKGKLVNTNLNQLGAFVADATIVSKSTKPGEIIV
jgi:UDP-N-acetylglucosamine diphosphorylase / glucose-1-phosphate thymidylyltransferase / UDP-N-acetylgalactosamine diphosphorylase / glucosamine-1-phosphate N-acetyltransferase / galactosamine-1-phosphate N-acetyltransferase